MSNAKRDENGVPVLLAGSNVDGTTIIPVSADPSSHRLKVSDGTTGSDHGPTNAPRDENGVPALMGVSSSDGITPVVAYATPEGKLLIKTS